jgi:glycine cleavage system transcriptional repressor
MQNNATVAGAILAGVGVDRPGIVNDVAHFLGERDCTIVDSQLTNLRGVASCMLLVHGTQAALDLIGGTLPILAEQTSLNWSLLPAKPLAETPPMRGLPYRLLSRGRDQAGVVPRLSHLLRVLSVNIENLRIDAASDPERDTGTPGFELNLLLSVPRETPISMLREYLGQLCRELGISCELSPASMPV